MPPGQSISVEENYLMSFNSVRGFSLEEWNNMFWRHVPPDLNNSGVLFMYPDLKTGTQGRITDFSHDIFPVGLNVMRFFPPIKSIDRIIVYICIDEDKGNIYGLWYQEEYGE